MIKPNMFRKHFRRPIPTGLNGFVYDFSVDYKTKNS